MLFQAQPKNQEVTVDALKRHLTELEGIAPERITGATGDQRELDGIDLFDCACGIEYVITIEALKEGWDCSFAYVFCSVARIRSAVDVEQLLGRVLRMPYASRRRLPDLDRAYAFVSEPSFGASAQALADKLVAMGFEEDEARESIEPVPLDIDGSGTLFDHPQEEAAPSFRHVFDPNPGLVSALREWERGGVAVHEIDEGAVELTVAGRVGRDLEEAILEVVPEPDRVEFAKAVAEYRINLRDLPAAPAGPVDEIEAPRLMAAVQGELELADTDLFMERHDWSLLDHSPHMDEHEFAIRETARSFEIDLDGHRIAYQFASEEGQLALNVEVEGWTPEALVRWLDRQVRQPDVRQGEWRPRKHFPGADRVPAFDGAEDGEELRCAQALDRLPGLRYWIRNVARHPASFWLPTAAGRFYPDFVALLDDGRLLVVEYKGAHLAAGPETAEKRTIGALRERESGGSCLFLMAEKNVDGKDVRRQLTEKIGFRYGFGRG